MVKEVYTHPAKIFPNNFGLTYWSLKMQIFKNQRWGKTCQKMSRIFSHFHSFWGVFKLFGKLGKASNFQSIFYSMKIKQREKQIVIVIFCLVILIVIFLEIVIFYFQSQKGTRKNFIFSLFFFFGRGGYLNQHGKYEKSIKFSACVLSHQYFVQRKISYSNQ